MFDNSRLSRIKKVVLKRGKMKKVAFSHKIDESFVECFEKLYDKLGPPKYRIIEAALEVFDALPNGVQYLLITYNHEEREPIFSLLNQIGKAKQDKQAKDSTIHESIEMVKHFVRYKIPSAEQQRLLDSLRQLLSDDTAARASAEKQRRKKDRHNPSEAGWWSEYLALLKSLYFAEWYVETSGSIPSSSPYDSMNVKRLNNSYR